MGNAPPPKPTVTAAAAAPTTTEERENTESKKRIRTPGPAVGIIIEKPPAHKRKLRKRARPIVRTIALETVTSDSVPLEHGDAKDRLRALLKQAEEREATINKVLAELTDEWDAEEEAAEEQQQQEERRKKTRRSQD
jgi:hypothetical protein